MPEPLNPRIVDEVIRLRLDGAQAHEIRDFGQAQNPPWNLNDAGVRRYVRRAERVLVRRMAGDRARLAALHVARREALFARAVNAGEYSAALAVLRDLGALQMVYPKDRAAELLALVEQQDQYIRELENGRPDQRGIEAGPGPADGQGAADPGPAGEAGDLPAEEDP